jgi:hypothetical protein
MSARPNTAERRGETRREQRRQHRPRISSTGDAERRALVLRWIPPRRQGQRHSKGCAGNAEDDTGEKNPRKAVDADEPDGEYAGQDDRLCDQSGAPRLEMIDHHAEDYTEPRAGEHGHRDHQPLLRVVELEVARDLHPQRPEHHPDHEGDVEIEERSEQRRRVTGSEERLVDHCNMVPQFSVEPLDQNESTPR